MSHRAFGLILWVVSTLSAGCHEHAEGKPTGAVCPTTQTLTYAGFGMAFFTTYCQGCHGSTVVGADRHGAPVNHSFDGVEDIRVFKDHIDQHAGAGPAAVNTIMPPADPKPTMAQRVQLSEWLACDAP